MDLPAGHWIHGVAAKEKMRLTNKSPKGTKNRGKASIGKGQPIENKANQGVDGADGDVKKTDNQSYC